MRFMPLTRKGAQRLFTAFKSRTHREGCAEPLNQRLCRAGAAQKSAACPCQRAGIREPVTPDSVLRRSPDNQVQG